MTNPKRQEGVFHAPLNSKDAIDKTLGCRHSNPDICSNNSLVKVCAFVREDRMCLKPPKSWPKQYERLKKS